MDMSPYVPVENPTFYILYFKDWSPLISGPDEEPVPLYKIPYTAHGNTYDDIYFWDNNYNRVYYLWIGSAVGERWALKQLQNHDSELNTQGRDCCEIIEKLTDIPTYYFLMNYRAWSHKQDRERKCPNCGGDWLIEGKTDRDFYAFKCDRCRLLSELSPNVR